MDIDTLMQTARDASPWILAILAATTVLAHALARAARAAERYAATTPATWDDDAARTAVRWADAFASALDWVSALLPRVGIGRVPTEPAPPRRRGPPPAVTVALACIVGGSVVAGCGAGAIGTHARAALVTTRVVATAGETIDGARAAALDRVEAEHPTDPEHDEAVREESSLWRPVGSALDSAREALGTWTESIDLARLAGDDALGLAELAPLAGRTMALVARVAALAQELGADVSGLPGWLVDLLSAVGVDVPAAGGAR